jgi:hypothetical protein
MSRKNKPFMKMTPGELQDTFDELGLPLNRSILEDARNADSDIVLALAVLDIPGVGSRIATYDAEYGDGCGIEHINEFIRECKMGNLLKPGETLSLRCFKWRAAVTAKSGIQ